MKFRILWASIEDFVTQFFDRFEKNKTTTWAASLAFYMALSLAPLLILFLTLSARVSPDLQASFIQQADLMVGPVVANGLATIIESAEQRADLMSFSGLVGTLTLLFSASLIFGQMREALNQIFDRNTTRAQADESVFSSMWDFAKATLTRVGFVVAFLVVMILSLIASTLISAIIQTTEATVVAALNIVISFLFYILIFSGLFHYLPNGRLPWRQAFQGGAFTAVLFLFGKELVGSYLGQSALKSSYGAAGSVVALLAWVYYSALIIFIGAHISYLMQKRFRSWT